MKYLAIAVFACAAHGASARAATCADLKGCAKAMYDLTGDRYVWDDKSALPKLVMVPDIELSKQNAEMVFTGLLDQLHLARVPIGDGKTFRIMPGAERKETEMPILDATAENEPPWPKSWDWVSMRYKVKSSEMAGFIEQKYRLHVPREARLQADTAAGLLIVSAATPIVRQMYKTIQAADVALTPAIKKQMEEEARKIEARLKEANKK
ncbi:MAG: hypothetical protein EOP11_10100 [Proteobacteria bacterium]|nr:MAG: hypothetical protein EOP11_10100 [Pseudomonadota bacterium]